MTTTTAITTDASTMSRRRIRYAGAVTISCALLFAACGSDSDTAAPAASDTQPASAAPAADEGSAVSISTASTTHGDVLADAGLSLYGFLPDEAGAPTCGGGCAEAWPPVLLPSADLPDGLDSNIFSVVEGLEGGFQLVAGGWPLYRFAGDSSLGDANGQGSGGNWFLAAPDGSLINDEAAAATDASETSLY